MSTSPNQQHNGSAAPSARGKKQAKAKRPAKARATKPTVPVTLAVIERHAAAKQGGKFTPGSIRKAILGRDGGPNSHEVWHAVRKLAAEHPEAFEHISGHKYALRQAQPAVGGLVLEDEAHADDPAERADFERGAVASAAMAETDEESA